MTDFYRDRGQADWLEKVTDDMIMAGQRRTNSWGEVWASGLNQTFNNQRSGTFGAVDEDGNAVDVDIQVNYAFPNLVQDMAIQSQRRPQVFVEPHDEQEFDEKQAEKWQGILQHQYMNELGMPELNNAASIDAFCFGLYIAKVFWDPHAEWDVSLRRWIGKPQANLLFPPYFGADPECERIDQSTGYVYSGRRVSLDWVLRRWGRDKEMENRIIDAAEKDPYNSEYAKAMNDAWSPSFTPYGTSETELATSFQHDGGQDLSQKSSRGRILKLINAARGYGISGDKDNSAGRPRKLTLFEVYFRDLTEAMKEDVKPLTSEELEDKGAIEQYEDGSWRVGNPEMFKDSAPHLKEGDVVTSRDWPSRTNRAMEPSFPRGRFALKIGQDLILNPKEEDQVYPYKKWPYVTGVFHELPHIWEGLNGTEMSENLQTMINTTYTSLLNLVRYHGNPLLEVDKSKLADPSSAIESSGGGLIEVGAGNIGKAAKFLERAGLPAETIAIADMLDRQIQGTGGKHDQSLGRAGQANVTATEIAAKQESDIIRSSLQIQHRDKWNKTIMELVVELDQANLEPGQILQMTGKEYNARRAEVTQALIDMDFAITLQIGTGLPFDKEKKKQDMERIASIFGPIPIAREILEAFEIDNVDEVLERVDGYQQFVQFMEQLQAAQEQAAQDDMETDRESQTAMS